MFRGINAVKIDAKGRLAVPARYRAALQTQAAVHSMIITIDTEDPCLLLYPMDVWEEIEQKIEALPSFNKVTRRIKRLLIGHATEVDLDGQGRILVPPLLRAHAQLEGKAMLVGQGKKFEIWGEAVWQSERDTWLEDAASEGNVLPDDFDHLSV